MLYVQREGPGGCMSAEGCKILPIHVKGSLGVVHREAFPDLEWLSHWAFCTTFNEEQIDMKELLLIASRFQETPSADIQ